MKKYSLFLVCYALLFPFLAQDWYSVPAFPGVERDDASGFILGNELYVGAGLSPWWSPMADFYSLNLTTNQWSTKAALPAGEERQYATSFVLNGKGYVFGGYNGVSYLNDLWQYDEASDTWSLSDSLPSFGRSGSTAFVLNNKAYLVGGKHATGAATDEVWSYDPQAAAWNQEPNMPFGMRWRSAGIAHNGLGYLLFGRDENNQFMNGFYSFDPITNQWESLPSFPSLGRSHASLFRLNDGVYACFGIDSLGQSHNDVWKFDELTQTWITLPGIPDLGRRGGVCLSDGNAMYYVTGIDEGNHRMNEAWMYAPMLGVDTISGSGKTLVGRYDVLGRPISDKQNQVVLNVYSDGTVKRIVQWVP